MSRSEDTLGDAWEIEGWWDQRKRGKVLFL